MLTDFEEVFSSEFPNGRNSGNCGMGYNDIFALQSPLSMPSVEPALNDSPNDYYAGGDYSTCSQPGSRSFDTSVSPNNRVADFSISEYDLSYNFLSMPSQKKTASLSQKSSAPIPFPQINMGCSQPAVTRSISEPQVNLTMNDIYSNFTLMQQQATAYSASQAKMQIKKIHKPKKQVFKPFASIESCELSVDRMRSFFETNKRKTKARLF